jgi:hypothetical protein
MPTLMPTGRAIRFNLFALRSRSLLQKDFRFYHSRKPCIFKPWMCTNLKYAVIT